MRTKSGSYFPFGDITRCYDCRSIGVTRSPVYHNRIMSNSGFLSLIPSVVCAPAVSVILHITSGAHTELVSAAKMLLPCRRGVGTIARRCPYGLRQGQRRKLLRRCPVSCLERCCAPVEITIGRASRMPSGVQHTRFRKAHTEKLRLGLMAKGWLLVSNRLHKKKRACALFYSLTTCEVMPR